MEVRRVLVEAPAKINLALRVLGRRSDGYHRLDTVVQLVELVDTVELTVVPGSGRITVGSDQPDLPTGPDNLAYRAAELFCRHIEGQAGINIFLWKQIPAAAGLGGGSSDAAGTLAGLNWLWGSPLTLGELREIGAQLGSDVPLFLADANTGSLRVGGRGEVLTPLALLTDWWVVLAKPPVGVSTAWAYAHCCPSGRRLNLGQWPPTLTSLTELVVNDLRPAVEAEYPIIGEIRRFLAQCLPVAEMTGSGSTVFALAREETAAREARWLLRECFPAVWSAVVPLRSAGVTVRPVESCR